MVAQLAESARVPDEREVRYCAGARQVASWRELPAAGPVGPVPWRDGGVYLITGGAGGLGSDLCGSDRTRGAKDAVIVLTGRSELDESRRARLSAIEGRGARIEYRRVDVADGSAVRGLITRSAGDVWRDQRDHSCGGSDPRQLPVEEDASGGAGGAVAEGSGVVNLDEATRDLTLDFMVLFASGAGAFGNVGQGDYAAANAFLDGYAGYRNGLVRHGERWGRTVSIAWPLWRDGGMQLPEATLQRHRAAGLEALASADGVAAFDRALAAEGDGIAVLSGEESVLRAQLAGVTPDGRATTGRQCGDRSACPGREDGASADADLGGTCQAEAGAGRSARAARDLRHRFGDDPAAQSPARGGVW